MTSIPPGITPLPNGQWTVTNDTHLSLWARQKGHIVTDPNLFHFLKPCFAHLKTIWDIGANIGDHTRQYLDWGMQVIAVEPNPLAFLCLAHNCPEATLLNAAASDVEGQKLPFMRLDNVGASRIHPDGDILVDSVVLDRMNLPKPDAIKIDVEGFEPFAIRGMRRTIEEHKPLVFCELNRGALAANRCAPETLILWFEDRGYSSDLIYPTRATRADEQYDILFIPKA